MRNAWDWGWLNRKHKHRAREVFPDDPIFEVGPFVMVKTPQPTAGAMAYAQVVYDLPPLDWQGNANVNLQQFMPLQGPQVVSTYTGTVQGYGGLSAGQIMSGPLINTQADAFTALNERLASLGGALFE